MTSLFVRNCVVIFTVAAVLLAVFEGSDHRVHVLPADASALGVLPAAFALTAVVTLVERGLRTWRSSANPLSRDAAAPKR